MQLAMPRGEEEAARGFFPGVLGMTEIDKPPVLAARGETWCRAGGVGCSNASCGPRAPKYRL
jgi:hypothetical protein